MTPEMYLSLPDLSDASKRRLFTFTTELRVQVRVTMPAVDGCPAHAATRTVFIEAAEGVEDYAHDLAAGTHFLVLDVIYPQNRARTPLLVPIGVSVAHAVLASAQFRISDLVAVAPVLQPEATDALDLIASHLSGKVWDADTLNAIAAIVIATGRPVEPPE
jgi:hypothetical protein